MEGAREKRLAGWRLVRLSALAVALMCAMLLLIYGFNEAGLRSAVRNTARTSSVFFVCAFVGRALRSLWLTRLSRWLAERETYLFASFTTSHVIHAVALFALAAVTRGESLEGRGATLVFGGLAYVFMFAICFTSFGRAASWVESHAYARTLRAVGLYLIWSIFLISFGGRAVQSAPYVPVTLLLLAALALRVAAAVARRAHVHPNATRAGTTAIV
jgi:sulfoxide reductase heme-binding subunit YedZ